jgi:hypothetical protein
MVSNPLDKNWIRRKQLGGLSIALLVALLSTLLIGEIEKKPDLRRIRPIESDVTTISYWLFCLDNR